MTVTPMLGDWEIPRISMMRTQEHRKLQEHRIPGRAGSLFQDLGTDPTEIQIAGSVFQEEERTGFLEDARQRFADAEPMTFVADIVAATEIQYVLIESLVVEEHAARPEELAYRMVLRESPPPPPPNDPFGALDSDLLDQAAGFVDGVTDALDAVAALGDIPDFSDPSSLVGGATDEATALLDGIGSIGPSVQSLFGSG
ncbi:hypothetical protein R5H30_12275 [Sulfitobacter sp. D35]|uniref:hypothetical protein n=1 Tax=Sulfitobacter sp. D35 TaxID=3083252 RepID=UPI00296FDF97|nr:hypothetical protein [Sulfitobacter sp. D35]MDW4498763.1 hypothetical protein [Sulfitobacter sp. D35]